MRCCCLLNTSKGSTVTTNKCNTCFYMKMDKDLEAPCVTCNGYSNWIPLNTYSAPDTGPLTVKEAIDNWFNQTNGVTQEDFWSKPDSQYDVVSKPKHYMLFPEKNIEVRDVLAVLADKIKMSDNRVPLWELAPLFEADYVQLMQYLMRFMDKNGVEDLKKARWYLDKLIDTYDESYF